jgi:hypothetical protein
MAIKLFQFSCSRLHPTCTHPPAVEYKIYRSILFLVHQLLKVNGVAHRELFLFGPELYWYADKRRKKDTITLSLLSRRPSN